MSFKCWIVVNRAEKIVLYVSLRHSKTSLIVDYKNYHYNNIKLIILFIVMTVPSASLDRLLYLYDQDCRYNFVYSFFILSTKLSFFASHYYLCSIYFLFKKWTKPFVFINNNLIQAVKFPDCYLYIWYIGEVLFFCHIRYSICYIS